MVLTPQEESLIGVIRRLPPDEVGKVFRWAHHLADLGAGGPVQWSDSWSEEDLADVTRVALLRFDDTEQETR